MFCNSSINFDSAIAIESESDKLIINELEKINKIKKFLHFFFPCHEFCIKLHPRAKVNSLLLHKFKLSFVNEYSKGASYWIENADIVVSTNSSVLATAVIYGKDRVISFDFNDSINSDIFKDVKGKLKLQNILQENDIEFRPIIGGNLLRQPCFAMFGNFKDFPNAEIVHLNGIYIGNNQFVDEIRISLLNRIIKMMCH